MAVSSTETALIEAGFARPGDGLRELAGADAADQADLFEGEPSLLAETARRVPSLADLEYLPPEKRGGRPSGAKGKATRELVQTLDRLGYKDPLIGAAEIVSVDFATLARLLGCDRLEAFDRWFACAKFLAEYKHQKMPIAINAAGAPSIPLLVALGMIPESAAASLTAGSLGRIEADDAPPAKSTAYGDPGAEVARSEGRTVALSD